VSGFSLFPFPLEITSHSLIMTNSLDIQSAIQKGSILYVEGIPATVCNAMFTTEFGLDKQVGPCQIAEYVHNGIVTLTGTLIARIDTKHFDHLFNVWQMKKGRLTVTTGEHAAEFLCTDIETEPFDTFIAKMCAQATTFIPTNSQKLLD
jgi:hypothetical protein